MMSFSIPDRWQFEFQTKKDTLNIDYDSVTPDRTYSFRLEIKGMTALALFIHYILPEIEPEIYTGNMHNEPDRIIYWFDLPLEKQRMMWDIAETYNKLNRGSFSLN